MLFNSACTFNSIAFIHFWSFKDCCEDKCSVCSHRAYILVEETDIKHINKIILESDKYNEEIK